jgi:hypothetical protein
MAMLADHETSHHDSQQPIYSHRGYCTPVYSYRDSYESVYLHFYGDFQHGQIGKQTVLFWKDTINLPLIWLNAGIREA